MVLDELRRMNVRQLASQGINLGLIVTSALIIWKSLVLLTGTESPVVVVLSGSMEPGFYRGDILFLYMQGPVLGTRPVRSSDIVVYNLDQREIPIVHRVSKIHERDGKEDGDKPVFDLLTKGDNNERDDRAGIYKRGQRWLTPKHIEGRVVGYLPYVGIVTILMNDYPMLKYALIGLLGLFVLTDKESS